MATVTLHWTLPTVRADGSALAATDIAATDIFDSASPGAPIASEPSPAATFTTGALAAGAHVFTVVVRDTAGDASAPSNAASFDVPAKLAPPAAITDLHGTLNP